MEEELDELIGLEELALKNNDHALKVDKFE